MPEQAPFAKHFQADGSFRVWQTRHSRYVGADYAEYLAFLAAGGTPDEVAYVAPPPVIPAPKRYDKLKIRRALRDLNQEQALDQYLASYSQAKADWYDAPYISEADPIVAVAIPALCQAIGYTIEQAQTLLDACQVD